MPSSGRGRNNGDIAVPSAANYTAPLAQYQVVGGGATHHRTGTVVANSSFSLSTRLPTDTEGYVVDDFTPPPAPAVIYAVPVEDGWSGEGGGQLRAAEYIIGGGGGGESSTDGDDAPAPRLRGMSSVTSNALGHMDANKDRKHHLVFRVIYGVALLGMIINAAVDHNTISNLKEEQTAQSVQLADQAALLQTVDAAVQVLQGVAGQASAVGKDAPGNGQGSDASDIASNATAPPDDQGRDAGGAGGAGATAAAGGSTPGLPATDKTAEDTCPCKAEFDELQATNTYLLERVLPQDAFDIGCKVSAWSDWGTCTAQCGPGTRSRTRTVEKLGFADASVECPGAAESEACELKKCPVDCVIGNWTEWQDCIPSCGPDSKQRRYRKITTAGAHSGTACGETTEVRGCDAACPDGTCSGGIFRTVDELARLDKCTFVNGSIEMINLVASDPTAETMAGYTKNIQEVTGSIKYFICKGVKDLSMFQGLQRVGGAFEVISCPDFISVAGPDQLTNIGGSVVFKDLQNEAFVSFDGFNAVTRVGGAILVTNLKTVTEFKGFETLKRIDGATVGTRALYFYYLNNVADYHGSFAELDHVGGSLDFDQAMQFGGIKRKLFPKLREVLGGLRLYGKLGNAVATAGVYFPELGIVKGTLNLNQLGQGSPVEMAGAFPKLKECQSISLSHSSFLSTGGAAVFGALKEVGTIYIYDIHYDKCEAGACPNDLDEWFPLLETVAGELNIQHSSAITSIVGFKNLETVTGTLSITVCNAITEVEFKSLETVGGNLEITSSPAITKVGFESLKSVKSFKIKESPMWAICRNKYNYWMETVTKSASDTQVQPGTFIGC